MLMPCIVKREKWFKNTKWRRNEIVFYFDSSISASSSAVLTLSASPGLPAADRKLAVESGDVAENGRFSRISPSELPSTGVRANLIADGGNKTYVSNVIRKYNYVARALYTYGREELGPHWTRRHQIDPENAINKYMKYKREYHAKASIIYGDSRAMCRMNKARTGDTVRHFPLRQPTDTSDLYAKKRMAEEEKCH